MKKKRLFLAALALGLVLTTALPAAFGYFSTNTAASGGRTVRLGDDTHIDEELEGWAKLVTIVSETDSQPVWVRVKAFANADLPLEYTGEGWAQTPAGDWPADRADGFWYYQTILNGGETAGQLKIEINRGQDPAVPGTEEAEAFDVVVVYETTPVQYRADGTPYADWDLDLQPVQVEGGAAE